MVLGAAVARPLAVAAATTTTCPVEGQAGCARCLQARQRLPATLERF